MNEQPASTKHDQTQNVVLIVVALLLLIQVVLTGYSLYRDFQRDKIVTEQDAKRAELLAAVTQYTSANESLSTKLLSDYEQDVYNNPRVDSAVKQQVIANDYIVGYLRLIIQQNNQLLQIVAGTP